ncbi:unnamed protein product [Dovyalis caffra]|uniref:Uncharacterized protein n=1 Tax=Dovyalis caffra TaxID=77055 RepID=A0AAV1S054_9ROSI|nr:unnamed protein product [Dovyalis caffra]
MEAKTSTQSITAGTVEKKQNSPMDAQNDTQNAAQSSIETEKSGNVEEKIAIDCKKNVGVVEKSGLASEMTVEAENLGCEGGRWKSKVYAFVGTLHDAKKASEKHSKVEFFRRDIKGSLAVTGSVKTRSGYVAMYVGKEGKRYEVPVKYLSNPVFQELLRRSQHQDLDYKIEGAIRIPHSTAFFDQFLRIMKEK